MRVGRAVETRIGGAPDEPAHLIKAASVARGLFLGKTTANGQLVHVPAYVAYTPAQTCYARNEQVTAACSAPLKGDPGTIVDSVTTAGLYNPLYYMLVGWRCDPDTTAPNTVRITVDSASATSIANGVRPDIAAAFPAYGATHGFIQVIPATAGEHTVCAYGVNTGPGSDVLLGCRVLTL